MEASYQCLYQKKEGIEKYYDVTFEVNKTTIKAVRFILEYTSQYFKDLFSTLPHFQSPLHTIVIEDTTPEAFQTIIIYLSYGEINLQNSSILDVLLCTEKFNLPDFQSQCITYISKHCDFELWFRYWLLRDKYKNSSILFNIGIIIDTWASNNISEIFSAGKISTLTEIHILRVLSTENIKIQNENKLLEYLIQWSCFRIKIYRDKIEDVKNIFLNSTIHIQWNNVTQVDLKNIQFSEILLDQQALINLKEIHKTNFVNHSRRYDFESLVNNQFEEIKISNKRSRDEDCFINEESDDEFCYMIKKQKML